MLYDAGRVEEIGYDTRSAYDEDELAGTPWCRVRLHAGGHIWCLVDADDYPWIVERNWNYGWHNKTPWKFYAKRNVGPGRSTVYLHREILMRADPRPADEIAVLHGHHGNGQSLDNRKANLGWATVAENTSIRLKRAAVPMTADEAQALLEVADVFRARAQLDREMGAALKSESPTKAELVRRANLNSARGRLCEGLVEKYGPAAAEVAA